MASGSSKGLQTIYMKGNSEEKSAIMFVLPEDQKPFQCGLCCVAFDINRELVTHIKAHLLTKPFQCGYCKVSYETNLELTVHLKTHEAFVSIHQRNISTLQNVANVRCGLQESAVTKDSQDSAFSLDTQNCGLITLADRKEASSVRPAAFRLETHKGQMMKNMDETFPAGSKAPRSDAPSSETKSYDGLRFKESGLTSENHKLMTTVMDRTTLQRSDASKPNQHSKRSITRDAEDDSLPRSEMMRLETDIQEFITKIKEEDSLSPSEVFPDAYKPSANSFTDDTLYTTKTAAEDANDGDGHHSGGGDNNECLSSDDGESLRDSESREDDKDANQLLVITQERSARQSEMTIATSSLHDFKHISVKQEQDSVENPENASQSGFEDNEQMLALSPIDERTLFQETSFTTDTTASAKQTSMDPSLSDHRHTKLNDDGSVDPFQVGQHDQNSACGDDKSSRPFVCSICGDSFRETKHVSDHIQCVHKKGKDQNVLLLSIYGHSSLNKNAAASASYADDDDDHSPHQGALKSFKCEVCERTFKFRHHLTRHILTVHYESDLRLFECGVCGHKFKLSHHLKYHFDACHGSSRPHQCHTCGQKFKLVHHLKRHASSCPSVGSSANCSVDLEESGSLEIEASSQCHGRIDSHSAIGRKRSRKVGKNKATLCHVCGKSVHNSRALHLHILALHSDVRPYQCNLCTKAYTCKTSLDIHTKTHTKEKPFICEICGRSFATKKTLKYHRHTHTNARPYQCELCQKGFNAHSGLKKHRLMHDEDKRYTCDKCGKKFYTSGLLKRHAVTHTDLRPLSCKKCGKTYRSSSSLKYHMTHIHP